MVSALTRELWGRNVSLLVPPALLANAYFFRFSWASQPESVSIALTTGSVFAAVRYTRRREQNWFVGSVFLLVLAVANHSWEAVVAPPLVAVTIYHRRLKEAAVVGAATVFAVLAVQFVTGLQPNPADPTGSYSVFSTGLGVYTAPRFLGYFTDGPHWALTNVGEIPLFSVMRMSLPISGVIVAGYYSLKSVYTRFRDENAVLVASWSVSGLAVLFALPDGLNHPYYKWGLVVPVTLAAVLGVHRLLRSLGRVPVSRLKDTAVELLVVGLVVLAGLNGFVFEAGYGPASLTATGDGAGSATADPQTLIEAGGELRALSVEDSDSVVFAGNWSGRRHAFSQVLIYGEVMVDDTWRRPRPETMTLEQYETDPPTDCSAVVALHRNETVTVESC